MILLTTQHIYNINDPQGVYTEYDALIQINNDPNAINIYLVNSAVAFAGAARYKNNYAVIVNSSADSTTTPHEIGHCFNLYHTHRGTWECERSSSTCIEIDGVNNATCGDEVADTPADPGLLAFDATCSVPLNYLVDINCNYTGGGGFNPDTANIMSYSRNYCREIFTSGQNTRIRQAFASSSILQNVVSSGCSIPNLRGVKTVCNSNKTFTLENGGNSVSWQVSSNLQILSSNNSSITVKAKYSSSSGNGFVRAILQYETLQNDIWVGKAEPNYIIFRNGVGGTYYWCSSHTDNEFEILPRVPNTTYQVRVKNFPALNVIAGPYSFTGNIATLPTDYNYTPGWYIFEVKATNECGTTDWFGSEVEFVDCSTGGGGEYRVYPNPTSETLTIEKNNLQQTAQSENLNSANREITGSFELYDFSSNLLLSGKLSNLLTIDVSKYKKGKYILKIHSGGKTESHQIIVE